MTEGYVDGGKLEIEVVADLKGLTRQLRTGVAAASQGVAARVTVDVTGTGLKRKLAEAAKLAGAGVSAKVGIDFATAGLKGKLRAAVRGLDLAVPVKLNPVATGLKAKLKALAKANDVTITAKVEPSKGAARALQQVRNRAAGEELLTDALLRTQDAVYKNEDAYKKLTDALRTHGRESDQAERAANRHESAQVNLNKRLKSTADLLTQISDSEHLDVDTSRAERELENLRARASAVQDTIARTPSSPHGDDAAATRDLQAFDDARAKLTDSELAGVDAANKLRGAQQNLADAEANHGRSSSEYLDAERKLNTERQRTKKALRDIGRALDGLQDKARVVDVDVSAETAGAEALLDKLARDRTATITARYNTAEAERDTRAAEDAVSKLRASLSGAERSGLGLEKALRKQGEAAKNAHGDFLGFRDAVLSARDATEKSAVSIQRAERDLAALQDLGRDLDIDVSVETEAAKARLAELRRNQDVTLDVNLDSAAARAELAALEAPKDTTLNVNADTGAAAGQMALLSSDTSFAEARVLALAGAIALLGPALAPIGAAAVGAIAGISAAAAAAVSGVGVLLLSFTGVSDAVKALSDADSNAGKTAKSLADQQYRGAAAADAVTSATESLASARASAGNAATTAANRVASAERAAADADIRAKEAQTALTKARQDARQAAEDLVLQVRGGALAQRAATLEVARAKRDLDKVLASKTASKEARAEAQLTYDQAALNADEQTLRNKRLQAEQAKSAKSGIDGADGVQRALKGVRTAQTGVSDAERAIGEARRQAANQARQSAAAVASAQRGLITAQRNLAKATAEYGTAGSAALDTVRKKMAALSPAGQKFAEFLFGLKARFSELKATAEAKLFPGLEDGITALMPLLPRLNRFIGGVAGVLGDLFREGGQALASPFWTDFFDYMTRTAGPFLQSLGDILGSVARGFASLMIAFEPVSAAFIDGMSAMAASFADWAAGLKDNAGFQKFLDYIIKAGPEIVATLIALAEALIQIGEGLAPLGDLVLSGLRWLGDAIAGIPPDILTAVAAGIMAVVAALIVFNAVGALVAALATGVGLAIAGIGVAIALLAAGFMYAWEHSQKFRDVITEAFDTIRFVAGDVWSVLQGILNDLGVTGSNAGEMVVGAMEGAAAAFKAFADMIEYNWYTVVKPILEGDFAKIGDEAAFFAGKLSDAERRLAEAQIDSKTAQDNLNDSRRTAAERAQELAQRERDLRGDQQGAALNVRETRLRLAEVKQEVGAHPKSEKDKLRLDQAQFGYGQAVKREQAIRDEITKTRAERQKAAAEAKTGSAEALAAAAEAQRKVTAAGQAAVVAKQAQDTQRGTSDGSFWDNMKTRAGNVFGGITTTAQNTWTAVESFITGVGDRLNTATGGGFYAYLDAVRERFEFLRRTAGDVGETVLRLFTQWRDSISNVLTPVFETMKNNFAFVLGLFRTAGSVVRAALSVVFGLVQIALKIIGDKFAELYYRYVKPAWTAIYDTIYGIWAGKIKPILQAVGDFFASTIAPAWRKGTDLLASIFDRLRDAAKKPIVFIIDEILNKGILKGYNELAQTFDVKPDDVQVSKPAGWARGGPVWGPGTSTSDSILARLSDDEHVWTAREVRGAGGHGAVAALREAAARGQITLPGFAAGGAVSGFLGRRIKDVGDLIAGAVAQGRDLLAKGAGALAAPLRGAMSTLLNLTPDGGSPVVKVLKSLPPKILDGALNWLSANASPSVTGPGTALSPSLHTGEGTSSVGAIVAMARSFFPGALLSSGLRDSNDYHGRGLAADIIGGGAAGMKRVAEGFYGISGSLLELIHSAAPGFFVKDGRRVSSAFYRSVLGEHFNHVHIAATAPALAAAGGPAGGRPGAGGLPAAVTRWTPLVVQALGELGQSPGLAGAVLRRIKFESGGNPAAINLHDSNFLAGHPSQGLMQTIPSTFAAHAGPYRSRGITDPLANIYAGLHYALGRYGSIGAIDPLVRPFGYDSGGKLAPGWSAVYNGTGKPEVVLTDTQWQALSRVAASAVLPAAALRGGYGGQLAGRTAPATAAAAPAQPTVVNVYPRAGHSEAEIGRIAAREIEWARGAAW